MLNQDQQEIEKFSALAKEWWDKNGPFKPLHELNPYRMQFIEEHATLADQTVLDVGCGGGILTESLFIRGAKAKGIDLSAAGIQAATAHAKQQQFNIHYECISVEALAEKEPEKYDVVTCMELLEHVPDPSSIIQACAKLCKPGGKLFFSTINRNPKAYALAVIGAEYLLKLVPRGTHDYKKFIKPSELCEWLQQAELTAQSLKGMHYNPLTKRFSINSDVSVNYMLYATKSAVTGA